MKWNPRPLLIACALAAWATSAASGTGHRDVVRLDNARLENGEWHVALHVQNSRELAGLDLPLRFAAANAGVELLRVDFSDRVGDWDFKHAQIDNASKTVVLGLISELVNVRPAADLKVSAPGSTQVADLVFRVEEGSHPEFSTFTTEAPAHRLTFLYNRMDTGKPVVAELTPEFESSMSFRQDHPQLPGEFALSQAYPNPFNPTTSFTLTLPEASDYTVRIFNVSGQLVKSMAGHLDAGTHRVTWDGRSTQGQPVASGTYFFSAQAGSFQETRRMTLLK
jgi:hypothetical protein